MKNLETAEFFEMIAFLWIIAAAVCHAVGLDEHLAVAIFAAFAYTSLAIGEIKIHKRHYLNKLITSDSKEVP